MEEDARRAASPQLCHLLPWHSGEVTPHPCLPHRAEHRSPRGTGAPGGTWLPRGARLPSGGRRRPPGLKHRPIALRSHEHKEQTAAPRAAPACHLRPGAGGSRMRPGGTHRGAGRGPAASPSPPRPEGGGEPPEPEPVPAGRRPPPPPVGAPHPPPRGAPPEPRRLAAGPGGARLTCLPPASAEREAPGRLRRFLRREAGAVPG